MTEGHCATHSRRPAAATCAACGQAVCTDCVVHTGVGIKCPACTGGKAVATNPNVERIRTWRPSAVAVAIAVGMVIVLGAAAFAVFRPSPMSSPVGGGLGEPAAGDDSEHAEREVAFGSDDDLNLEGTLTIPAHQDGHAPAVVIVSGFGPTDRDGVLGAPGDPLYRDLAESLADQGLVVLRYDKRGAGDSDRIPDDNPLTFDQRVDDAAAAVAYVRNRPEVDGGQVGLVGHDEGGLISMRVAGDDANLGGLVLIGTPGRPFVEVVTEAYDDVDDEAHDEVSEEIERAVDELLATGELPQIDESLGMGITSVLPEGQDAYLHGLFSVDPTADAAEVTSPVLIVHGERDPNINRDTDVDPLREALADAEVLTAPDAGHTLNLLDDDIDGVVAPEDADTAPVERDEPTLVELAEWLAAQLPGG